MAKKIIVLIAIVLILVAGGVFWWRQQRKTPPEKWDAAKVSPRKDYIVKETPEGKIVENKKIGISFLIPLNWFLKENTPSHLPDITFYSPDAKINEKRSTIYLDVLERGCRINVNVAYIKTNLDTLERTIKEQFSQFALTKTIDVYEKIELSNQKSLKHIFNSENLKMYYITIHLPYGNKLYIISLSTPFQDQEKCTQEFNKFLDTVSID